MKVGSINIRGMGAPIKKKKLRSLIESEKLDFLAVQETKLEQIDERICELVWGRGDFGWHHLPASGNSGGLLSIWDSNIGSLNFTFTGNGFSGVCLSWSVKKIKCFVVNIYSPCNLAGKRKLWHDLCMTKTDFGQGLWCLVGDFNAVTSSGERKRSNGRSCHLEMEEFNNFIDEMGLVGPLLLGRKFTWYKADGKAMSRLDRFLLSEECVEFWGVTAQWVLKRDISDYCPITLKMGNQNWGPKPFRFNNCWLAHPGFKKIVEDSWMDGSAEGWKAIVLKDKMKAVKLAIKRWNTEVFGSIEENLNTIQCAIEGWT